MVKINKSLVSDSVMKKVSYGYGNKKKYVVIHETANTAAGANANAHSRLQANGNSRDASWHFQVDDKEIIQSFDENIRCWHAGTTANNEGIAIEICVNKGGNFKKAVDNAVELVKYLMDKYNIPFSNVRQHNYFTGKDCPTNLRNGSKGVDWNDFIKKIKGSESSKPVSKPSQPSTSKQTGTVEILVDSLNIRSNASFSSSIVKVAKKGQKYKTYGLSNGLYNVGTNQWLSAGKAYVKFSPLNSSSNNVHKVQKGDTLWGIASKYKTTVANLKKLNNLKSDVINVGKLIKYK